MTSRVVVCILLASAVTAAQPRIERGKSGRVVAGVISPVLADADTRGTIIPINGRRTTVVRLDTAVEASARGFTASQLASFGIFAAGGTAANAVVGFARDSDAHVVPDAAARLRDLRRGAVVAHTTTNAGGQFGFPGLPTGTYVVELLTPEGHVAALSDALSVGYGQVVQTILQVSTPTRSFVGWVGGATATAVNSAVQAGVLALEAGPAASPES